jgi:hypothetical protein
MAGERANVPRRRFLSVALGGVALGLAPRAMSRATAREKLSQQEALYQDSPKDIRMCATCTLFEPPRSCKVVEGDISPNGWCKAYVMAD